MRTTRGTGTRRQRLEPDDEKSSRPVLRGLGFGNEVRPPDICWPTCARRSSAGSAAHMRVYAACPAFRAPTASCLCNASHPFHAAPRTDRLAWTTAPGVWNSMRRYDAAIVPARLCSPLPARCSWHAEQCANTPRRRIFPSAPRPSHSIIGPHLAYLHARLAEGCEDAAVLWREIRARGFTGTARQVRRWLSEHRTKPARTAPHRWRGPMPADPTPNGDTASRLPSSRQLAWLLVQPPTELMPNDAAVVARVEQAPETAIVAKPARRFTALVRACNASNQADPQAAQAELTAWLAEARASGVPAMETFAAGLEGDSSAISAALTTPWSNGQTEGQVNRLKLIKRQMFGHASFDLLRQRVLLAA